MTAGYGYRRLGGTPGHWVVDAQAAEVVRHVFESLDAGVPPASVARELAGRDPGWTTRRVVSTASNPVFAGMPVWGRTRSKRDPRTGARSVTRVSPEDWVVASRPDLAIVDEGLFERVAERLSERFREAGHPADGEADGDDPCA